MEELRELLAGRLEDAPLDVVALQIATVEYPEVSVEPFLVILDSYASEFAERVTEQTKGEEFLQALNEYMFDELGFHGNSDDYYSPANSCLNEVLTKRTGIPITLSLVYMEIVRRLGRTIHGIGLPGHFLVQYADGGFPVFIDVFHGGRILYEPECFELAKAATGADVPEDSQYLRPVSKRHIAIRMLNNLRAVYFRNENAEKAIRVLDLFIEAIPGAAEEYKQRGICRIQLRRLKEARADLETYLRLLPGAPDRTHIEAQLTYINRQLMTA